MFFSLAFKNIGRNVRRTTLSASAIFLVAVMLCLLFAFENGMVDDMVDNVKAHVTGDIRIRNAAFSENERIQPIQFFVPDVQAAIETIEGIAGVARADIKTSATVSIYRNDDTAIATVVGVDVLDSPFLHGKGVTLIDGRLPGQGGREVAITDGLAASTGLKVGDKFTFMTQTAARGTNGSTVAVVGILHIDDVDYNGKSFFMDWFVLASLLRMPGGALELLVRLTPDVSLDTTGRALTSALAPLYPGLTLEILPWTNVNTLYQLFRIMDLMYLYIGLFFFLIAATVIFNTTMMSILERKREIGTLVSLGYGPRKVMRLFLTESAMISFLASSLGCIVGAVGVAVMHRYGFDLNAMGGSSMSGMNLSNYVYPSLSVSMYLMIVTTGTCTAVLACVIPARKVLKIEPAEALRAEN